MLTSIQHGLDMTLGTEPWKGSAWFVEREDLYVQGGLGSCAALKKEFYFSLSQKHG